MSSDKQLKLLAQDADDLKVISAALQDAVARIGDLTFNAGERSFTAQFNRFQWEAEAGSGRKQRIRSVLRFHDVLSAKTKQIRRDAPEAVVEMLAVEFEAGEAPGGQARLIFAGGGEIRLELECVDAILADISNPWPTKRAPEHETDD